MKVKKYQNCSDLLTPLGIEFDYDNKYQESEGEKVTDNPKDFYEEEINCFDERPSLTGYILPEANSFEDLIQKNKKQLFKGAKLLARLRMEK